MVLGAMAVAEYYPVGTSCPKSLMENVTATPFRHNWICKWSVHFIESSGSVCINAFNAQ
jgi:hypothetical protein